MIEIKRKSMWDTDKQHEFFQALLALDEYRIWLEQRELTQTCALFRKDRYTQRSAGLAALSNNEIPSMFIEDTLVLQLILIVYCRVNKEDVQLTLDQLGCQQFEVTKIIHRRTQTTAKITCDDIGTSAQIQVQAAMRKVIFRREDKGTQKEFMAKVRPAVQLKVTQDRPLAVLPLLLTQNPILDALHRSMTSTDFLNIYKAAYAHPIFKGYRIEDNCSRFQSNWG